MVSAERCGWRAVGEGALRTGRKGVAILLLAGVSGCAGLDFDGPRASWAATESPIETSQLSRAIAASLSASLPRAKTELAVRPAGGPAGSELQSEIVTALRRQGFAVAADDSTDPSVHVVSYHIGPVPHGLLLRLDVDDAEMVCIYARNADRTLVAPRGCTVRTTTRLSLVPHPELKSIASEELLPPAAHAPAAPHMNRASPVAGGAAKSKPAVAAKVAPATLGNRAAQASGSKAPLKVMASARTADHAKPPPAAAARTMADTAMVPTHWSLKIGDQIGTTLKAWGHQAGWTVLWNVPIDWQTPTPADFNGSFLTAAEAVVNSLRLSGADIRAVAYKTNTTLVINAGGNARQGGTP